MTMSKHLSTSSLLMPSRSLTLYFVAICLSGCASLPRDAQKSTDTIRQSKVLVVGLSSSVKELAAVSTREKSLVQKVAQRLGARVQWKQDNAHTLLQELEEVKLPMVAATLPSDSPFAASVGLSQPYWKKGPNDKDYCLAVAPGENRLLLLVDQVIAEEQQSEKAQP
jgi:hypothetical protein